MGNRAVITTKNKDLAVYLHWNGGRDSVEAFLKYCELKGFRCPEEDNYGWARLCQVIGNFFGGDSGIGVSSFENLESTADWDNGVYIIEDWKIVGRERFEGQEQDFYKLKEMVKYINECQPVKEQISPEFIEKMLA